jgi:hypothetical protein
MLDHFRYCAHHAAGFVIFARLALLCPIIILLFPILSIIGHCNIAQTVSDSNYYLVKQFFVLSGRQSPVFRRHCNFLLLSNRGLCGFNSLSCPSGFPLNIIFNPFLFHFTAEKVCFSLFQCRKLLFGLQATQCPKNTDSFCLQAALAVFRLMTSSFRTLCRFADLPAGSGEKFILGALTIVVCVYFVVGHDAGCC